jgi:hypothetical protein
MSSSHTLYHWLELSDMLVVFAPPVRLMPTLDTSEHVAESTSRAVQELMTSTRDAEVCRAAT